MPGTVGRGWGGCGLKEKRRDSAAEDLGAMKYICEGEGSVTQGEGGGEVVYAWLWGEDDVGEGAESMALAGRGQTVFMRDAE